MSYVGLGGTPEIDAFNAAVKRSVAGAGREERLKAAAVALATRGVDEMVTKFRSTTAGKVIFNSGEAITNLNTAIQKIKKGEMDAAGIADVAQSGLAMFDNVAAIVSLGNQQAAQEITKWARTTTNCAVGIVAAGPWGALSCGLQVLSNFLDYIGGEETVEDWRTPRTVFKPHELSVSLIAADASRLANLLKYHYGVQTYEQLYARLLGLDEFKWLYGADDLGGYPLRPMMTQQGKVVAADRRPLPGHNLRSIAQLMSLGMGASAALTNARDVLAAVAGWRHGLEPSGRGLYRRYEMDQDVNHHAVATAAYWGRMAAAASGNQRVTVTVVPIGDVGGWPRIQPLQGTYQPSTTVMVDPRPFVIVDELISFFGGVTRREIDLGGQQAVNDLVLQYGIGQHNPTQHLFVMLGDRRGEPDIVGTQYSRTCWTNLARSTGQACDLQNRLGPGVGDVVLRDVGAIRLMAAFSFLHQSYLWAHPVAAQRSALDPIRKVAPPTGQVADELATPVDPRTLLGTRLRAEEESVTVGLRASSLVRQATTAQAVSPGGMANSRFWNPAFGYAPSTVSPTALAKKVAREQAALQAGLAATPTAADVYNEAIARAEQLWVQKLGRPLSSTELAEIRRRVYGIETTPMVEIPTDVYQEIQRTLLQRASTLALKDPMRKLELRLEKPGVGAGGIVLLGAAALLALKLLR